MLGKDTLFLIPLLSPWELDFVVSLFVGTFQIQDFEI